MMLAGLGGEPVSKSVCVCACIKWGVLQMEKRTLEKC
jgi:hypothetical protein